MSSKQLLAVGAAAAALLAAPGTAFAADAPEVDVDRARLMSKGAAVRVDVRVLCEDVNGDASYPDVSLSVTVRQVQKKQKVVEGVASSQLRCDAIGRSRTSC